MHLSKHPLCHSLGVLLVKFAAVFRLLYGPIIVSLEEAEGATTTTTTTKPVEVVRDLKLESDRHFLSYAVQDVKDFLLLMTTVMLWRYPFVPFEPMSELLERATFTLLDPFFMRAAQCFTAKGDRLLQACLRQKSVEAFADELDVKPLYRLDGPCNLFVCPIEANPEDRASQAPLTSRRRSSFLLKWTSPPSSSPPPPLPAPPTATANNKNGAESSSLLLSSSSELTMLLPVLPPPWGPSHAYRPVLDILEVMHDASSPTSKLECLVQAMRAICECVAHFYGERLPSEKAALGADDILGILALVVACAKPASLWADVMVMDEFMLSHLRNGEEGYCLTLFMSAVAVLVSKCPTIHGHASLNARQLPPSSSILPVLVAVQQDNDGSTKEEDLEVYVKCNNCEQHMRIADTATHSCHNVSISL
jgi:hypothetical protein